ncbi:MAG TPA: aspartate kinase [Planctomycetes bacterium]|nr:aspartate kinase [Planctomycetota bacterium]HIL36396.1 aspartate kinase [Planctomycetota bacterium]
MLHRRVLKFGGAALADGPGVERVADIIAGHDGPPPVVIVSAHQGVTDLLEVVAWAAVRGSLEADRVRIRHRTLLAQLGLPSELLDRFWRELLHLLSHLQSQGSLRPQDLDLAWSFGERSSARIVAHLLRSRGIEATPVDAWDLGFLTDSLHGQARPLEGITDSIRGALAEIPGVAVVTGFLAKDPLGRLTTLGRNGSDLTASCVAEAISAPEIQFWKTVSGIMTADPFRVSKARLISQLGYGEAAELAFHGAQVLHPAAVAPAVRARVAVTVRNVANPDAPGTRLVAGIRRKGPVAVASRADLVHLECVVSAPEARGLGAAEFFAALEERRLSPTILTSSGDTLGAFVPAAPGIEELAVLWGERMRITRDLASVALVGKGNGRDRKLGQQAYDLLDGAGIEVRHAAIGARTRSQAFVVHREDLNSALALLHDLVVPELGVGAQNLS